MSSRRRCKCGSALGCPDGCLQVQGGPWIREDMQAGRLRPSSASQLSWRPAARGLSYASHAPSFVLETHVQARMTRAQAVTGASAGPPPCSVHWQGLQRARQQKMQSDGALLHENGKRASPRAAELPLLDCRKPLAHRTACQPSPCAAPNLVCGTIRHHYSINTQNGKLGLSCYCQQQVAHRWDGCPHARRDATHRVCGAGAEQRTTEGGLSDKLGSQHRHTTADAPYRPGHAASQLT